MMFYKLITNNNNINAIYAALFTFAITIAGPMPLAAKQNEKNAPPTIHDFTSMENLYQTIKSKPPAELVASKFTTIKEGELPWSDTGLDIKKGQWVTFLLGGILDFGADIKIQPGVAFWAGFGKKLPTYISGTDTSTIQAPASGRLYFARSLTEWKNRKGELATPVEAYKAVKGNIHVITLVWRDNPRKGMNQIINKGASHPLVHTELQNLKSTSKPPKGWYNMWLFGQMGIFKDNHKNGERQIDVFTHKDVGILQTDVDLPLAPNTQISWDWIISQLPSQKPEDTVPTHDYMSLAVEFDDGQDLTYIWSNGLPVGKHFRCPIPRWAPVETHYVIRNDKSELKKWIHEERDLFQDYNKFIGGKAKRIVRVWFIANTVFQRGYGIGSFKNIVISNQTKKLQVL